MENVVDEFGRAARMRDEMGVELRESAWCRYEMGEIT